MHSPCRRRPKISPKISPYVGQIRCSFGHDVAAAVAQLDAEVTRFDVRLTRRKRHQLAADLPLTNFLTVDSDVSQNIRRRQDFDAIPIASFERKRKRISCSDFRRHGFFSCPKRRRGPPSAIGESRCRSCTCVTAKRAAVAMTDGAGVTGSDRKGCFRLHRRSRPRRRRTRWPSRRAMPDS